MKVVKKEVIKYEQPVPVYDIVGTSNHNFLCGSGTVVHNCVTGDTCILTQCGFLPIHMFAGKKIKVGQYNVEKHRIEFGYAKIVLTNHVHDTIKIILDNGMYIEGTDNHKVLVNGKKYIPLKDVDLNDRAVVAGQKSSYVKYKHIIHTEEKVPVYDVVGAKLHHNFICNGGIVAHNCDEMNFAKAGIKDVTKAKEHMMDLYNTVADRVKGTFRVEGQVQGKLFAVSSKRSDSDFMEAYIQNQLQSGAGDHIYVSDAPQWEVLPSSMFRKEKFYIAVGDRYKKGFVVSDKTSQNEDALEKLKDEGYTLLTPPIDMKSQFLADFDIALRDLAGISVPGALSFITQRQITQCIGVRDNPFMSEILEIGTDDRLTIEEFFDINKIDKRFFSMRHFIHLDLSLSGDKTGISDVCISGRKDIKDMDGKVVSMPAFTHIFSVSLKAPRGSQIPFDKITTFLVWLRKQGLNINNGISRDQYQSEYMGQLLEAKGLGKVPKISLDRTPDGYMALRSVLSERRIDLLDVELLQNEMIHLQRDAFSGKVDHPIGGCFTGDTKVQLVDGRVLSMVELVDEYEGGKRNFVYTVNEETQEVELGEIKRAFLSKVSDGLVDITLSNYEAFMCTPEHRIMLSDGSYKEAQLLEAGDQLKSINGQKITVDFIGWHQVRRNVYDLTIDKNPNFLLQAGVFVHNSKDMSDSVAGAVWNAIQQNPGVPVKGTSVASAIRSVNQPRASRDSQLASMFPGVNKFNQNRYRR